MVVDEKRLDNVLTSLLKIHRFKISKTTALEKQMLGTFDWMIAVAH